MSFPILKNLCTKIDYTNNKITDFTDIKLVYNTMNKCFNNKTPCLLSDNSLSNVTLDNEITIVYNGLAYYLSWELLFAVNDFIEKKHVIKNKYTLNNTFLNVFFLKIVNHSYQKYYTNKNCLRYLLGNNDAIFGIYHTFQDSITNCKYKLYYSFSLCVFTLYRVYDTTQYIVGKLPGYIKYKKEYISILDRKYNCPKTFKCINSYLYGIRKKDIEMIVKTNNTIQIIRPNTSYLDFNLTSQNQLVYYYNLDYKLNKNTLSILAKYIFTSLPDLKKYNSNVLYEPNDIEKLDTTLSIYFKTIKNRYYVILHINQSLLFFTNRIMEKIEKFFKEIKNKNSVNINSETIEYVNPDTHIHLVSEIYYFIVCVLVSMPKIVRNIHEISNSGYIQANYVFKKHEIDTIYNTRNKMFKDIDIYLKSVIIKTLSIYTKDIFCFIKEDDVLEIMPIKSGMSNNLILSYLDKSEKSGLTKNFILSFLSTIFNKLSGVVYPIVIINVHRLNPHHDNKIEKVYAKNKNQGIPIFINILYNKNTLHISISYKPEYSKFKSIFDNVVDQLLEG